jgi:1,4-dihydroxy-2-naphthoate octaprenyltransferase
MGNVILATRPWSLTAAAVPVLLTCAVELETLRDLRVLQLLGMGILAQAGANLINTYWDWEQGVDKDERAGDRGILDGVMTPMWVAFWGYLMIILSGLCTLNPFLESQTFQIIFCVGAFLGVMYTMPPLKLKYRACGDICILLCFGPIIMQACSVVLTEKMDPLLYYYSVPVALMTEGILWAGNTRDIAGDAEAGVRTLQNLMGHKKSSAMYKFILLFSYATVLPLPFLTGRYGVLLTMITIPIAIGTYNAFTDDNLHNADERNAQLHLPFGMMMVFGVLLEAQIKAQPTLEYWVWVICSFFATLATLMILKFAQCKVAPSLDVDWGNYNVNAFDKLYGPIYGVNGTGMRYFVGTLEILGGLPTIACVWVDDPRAYFLSVGAMIGLGTIFAGALLTLAFMGKCKTDGPGKCIAGQMGPAIFPTVVFWSVAATRYSLVPGPESVALYSGYNLKQIVQIFALVCACGLCVVAPLMHCTIGVKTYPPEYLAMDDHFFLNGNKWTGEQPDGFGDAAEEELLEDVEYDEEEAE